MCRIKSRRDNKVEVTGVLADALNWAGISEDEFNAALADCTGEAERNQLIMDTLSATYDDASDAFYANNEQVVQNRENQQKLDDAMADVGESVSKLKNAFLNEYTPAIETAAGATANFLDTLSDPSTWANIGQSLSYIQAFVQQIITGESISNAKKTAEKIADQYYVTSGEAARQAAKDAQAADDAIVSNAEKNAFILKQNAKETGNAIADAVKETENKVTGTGQKVVEKQKTLFEQLQESFKSTSDSYATNASIAALELEIWQNQFGETATASEQMQHQTESLNAQLAEQKKAVDAAQNAYNQIVKSYGATSAEAAQFHEVLLQETADYQELQKQVEETAKRITDAAYKATSGTWGTKASIAVLEFETWSNAFEDTATESEKLEKQLESLKAQEQAQKEVVDAAQKAYDDLVAAYGETSDEALEYKEILLQETKAHQELQSEIDDTTEALKKSQDAFVQFAEDAKNAFDEAQNFASSLSSLGSAISAFEESTNGVAESEETTANKLEVLSAQYNAAKIEVEELTDAFNKSVEETGAASVQSQQLAEQLENAQSKLSNLQSRMDSFSGPTLGEFISNMGSSINSVLNLIQSIAGLIQTISSLSTAIKGLSSVSGVLSAIGSALGIGGTAAAAGTAAAGTAAGGGILATIGSALGSAASVALPVVGGVALVGGAAWLLNKLFGKKPTGTTTSDIAVPLPDTDKITVGTVTGSTSGGNTVIEKVEIYIEGSQYKDEDSLAEAISIKLQNLTERKVNVFA